MEVACYRIQLKENMITKVKDWANRLNSEIIEVKVLLEKEGVTIESAFLEQSETGNFLVYYLRAANIKKALDTAKASQHPVDIFHRKVMSEITANINRLECLIDFTTTLG